MEPLINKYQQLVKIRDIEEYKIFKHIVPLIPDLRLRDIKSETGRLSLSPWNPWKALYEELLTLDESQLRGNYFDSDFLLYVITYQLDEINEETNNLHNFLFKKHKLIENFFYTYPTLSWVLIEKYQGARQFAVYVNPIFDRDLLNQVLNLRLSKDEVSNLLLFVGNLGIGNEILIRFGWSNQAYERILNQAIQLNALAYFRIQDGIYFKDSEIDLLVELNRTEIIKILIKRNIVFSDHKLQLMILSKKAVSANNIEIIETIVKYNKHLTRSYFNRILIHAITFDKANMAKHIIDLSSSKGYTTLLDSQIKCSMMSDAIRSSNYKQLQLFLLLIPLTLEEIEQCNRLMRDAIFFVGSLEMVKALINAGFDPYKETGTIYLGPHSPFTTMTIPRNYLTDVARHNFDIFKYLLDNYEGFDRKNTLFGILRRGVDYGKALRYLLSTSNFDKETLSFAKMYGSATDIKLIKSYLNKFA